MPLADIAVEIDALQHDLTVDANGTEQRNLGVPEIGISGDVWRGGRTTSMAGSWGVAHHHGAWPDLDMPIHLDFTRFWAEAGARYEFPADPLGAFATIGLGVEVGTLATGPWGRTWTASPRIHASVGLAPWTGRIRPFVELRLSLTPRIDFYTGSIHAPSTEVEWTWRPGGAGASLRAGARFGNSRSPAAAETKSADSRQSFDSISPAETKSGDSR